MRLFRPNKNIETVSAYLAQEVEKAYSGSAPEVSYTKGTKGPEFCISFTPDPKADLIALHVLWRKLEKIFGDDLAAPFGLRTEQKPEGTKYGFNVAGKPDLLLSAIKRNDAANLPQAQKAK